jgi:hypothetical protein
MTARRPVFVIVLVLLAGVLLKPIPVSASVPKNDASNSLPVAMDIATHGCACAGHEAAVLAFRDRLAAAPTPEAARALALSQTRLAHKALSRAKWIVPFSATVREANKKLEAYEARIRDARTQADVAAEFGGLVRVASAGDPKIVDAKMRANCDYTTTEIVIIIIGFLLGIIPGIIFLFLLC